MKAQAPKIFGKLLYGSKFHRLKQSRGQQGIGISAAAMYGQLTTGKPIRVTSRTGKAKPAHYFEIQIDTRKNNPVVTEDRELDEWHQEHGTRVELEIVANWQQGQRFVNRYVEHTALANPHATVHYVRPRRPGGPASRARPRSCPRRRSRSSRTRTASSSARSCSWPPTPRATTCAGSSRAPSRACRARSRDEIVKRAGVQGAGAAARPRRGPRARRAAPQGDRRHEDHEPADELPFADRRRADAQGLISFLNVIETEGPETDEQLDLDSAAKKKATKKEKAAKAEARPRCPTRRPRRASRRSRGHNYFIATVTRPPKVYRGNPFQVEVGLAYGGSWPADKPIELFRFANRVPLLFQRGACGTTDAIVKTDWRNYLLSQPKGSLPVGPMALLVHIASVWVPFTSEAKEAVAHYPEIIRGDPARGAGVRPQARRAHPQEEARRLPGQRRSIFELYIQEVAQAIGKITGKARSPIKREFLRLANRVTEAEMTRIGRGARGAVEEDREAPAPGRGRARKETLRARPRRTPETKKTVPEDREARRDGRSRR